MLGHGNDKGFILPKGHPDEKGIKPEKLSKTKTEAKIQEENRIKKRGINLFKKKSC